MSKAPTVRPKNTKRTHNGCIYYTYWRPVTLKSGKVVYHKKTDTRKIRCLNIKEKKKHLHKAQQRISHCPSFSLEEIQKFRAIIEIDPLQLKKWINERSIMQTVV